MAATGANFFPSLTDAISSRGWTTLRVSRRQGNISRAIKRASIHTRRRVNESVSHTEVESVAEPSTASKVASSVTRPQVPDCLSTVPVSAIGIGLAASASRKANMILQPSQFRAIPRISHSLPQSSMTLQSLGRPLAISSCKTRTTQPHSALHSFALNSYRRSFSLLSKPTISHHQLAHAERTANNNPTSISAQNAFYAALLKAGHAEIVRERYQTGRYAANESTMAMYVKALETLGKVPSPGTTSSSAMFPQGEGLNQQTMQAVGQAVAGGQTGSSNMTGGDANATGTQTSPLHVTVSESWSILMFRWFRLLAFFGFTAWVLSIAVALYVETTTAGGLRSRAGKSAEVAASKQTVRFSDVHGCEEAKDELVELVEFLKNPERFSNLGGKLPKGVLLVGPPGTGKTLLAKAVAGEAGCSFFYMSGSEFDEMYVGVGAKRVRDLFNQARQKSPAIIFIDELDAVGGKRSERDPSYAKQTLNQLLTELDGFSSSSGIILIGATNYPQSLDKALTRPGRFDRKVVVPLPDVRGRIDILKHHMRNVQISTEVDATVIGRGTSGFSGADLENLVNQAAVRASRLKLKKVGPLEFDWAKDRIIMGAENRSRVIKPKDKLCTAYHEAGHALVNHFTPESMPLYKITIIPRGMSLGATHFLPEMDDEVSKAFDQYLADIDTSLGGYAAEELIYGTNKITSGASSDIQMATDVAQRLVTSMGYSRKLGSVDLRSNYESLSSETKSLIEGEVRSIVEAGRDRAMKILKDKRKELESLKDALMEYETLTADEMKMVIKGEKLKRLDELYPTKTPPANETGEKKTQPEKKDDDKDQNAGKKGGIKLPDFVMDGVAGTGEKKA